jgi:hypothetical protein
VKSEELRKHIVDTIMSFSGRENTDEVRIEMFKALAKIINENPTKLNFIERVIKEEYNERLH